MSSDCETRCGGHLFDELFDGMFLFDVRDNINCGATRYAHEMVVVPGEPLGQLEPHDALGVVLRKWRREPNADAVVAPREVAVSAKARQRIEEELRNLN